MGFAHTDTHTHTWHCHSDAFFRIRFTRFYTFLSELYLELWNNAMKKKKILKMNEYHMKISKSLAHS